MTALDDLSYNIKAMDKLPKMRRENLKAMALCYGIKVKWYYTNSHIRRLCIKSITRGYDHYISIARRDQRENRGMKFGLTINISTILLITYSAFTKGVSVWHFVIYFIAASYAHYHANKIK